MSGTSRSSRGNTDDGQRWAALDKRNERVVDATHPLLAELRRERAELREELPAAS
jgi:hypothetical protein